MLSKFFSEDSLDDGYKYSDSGVYYAPDLDTLQQYEDYINSLPLEDNTEIFGMHNNANLAFQVSEIWFEFGYFYVIACNTK